MSSVKRLSPACFIILTACLSLLVSCRPPVPSPTPTLLSTATSSPQTTPSPTASLPPASPTSSVSSTPIPTVVPVQADWTRSLRPSFVTDVSLLPDAPRYDIDLAVHLDSVTVVGQERVVYTNTETVPLDAIYLRLFPNTPGYGGEMRVTDIALNGQPVEPVAELGGSALRLPLDPPVDPGTRIDLTLDFTLSLPTEDTEGYRQLGYYDGVLALANAYPLIPVYDDEGWNVELAPTYGDAVYSDAAFYQVTVTAPTTMTLAASGTCARSASDQEGYASWNCIAGPMRDFNATLGPDYEQASQDVDGVAVNSLFYAEHEAGGEQALDYAVEATRFFSAWFGPYPFTEVDVVESPTLAGGIEYPGLVVINSSYYENLSQRMEWVVVHEVGHQWWYSLVGNDQVDEPWLDEALVQYSTLLYYEERYGSEVADRLLAEVFRQPYENLLATERDAPVGLPVAAYSGRDYGQVVYQKGPLYFHELRQEVGDEAFWDILRLYFERHRHRIARPEDWLEAVEAVTGDTHYALYEAWIAGG